MGGGDGGGLDDGVGQGDAQLQVEVNEVRLELIHVDVVHVGAVTGVQGVW